MTYKTAILSDIFICASPMYLPRKEGWLLGERNLKNRLFICSSENDLNRFQVSN